MTNLQSETPLESDRPASLRFPHRLRCAKFIADIQKWGDRLRKPATAILALGFVGFIGYRVLDEWKRLNVPLVELNGVFLVIALGIYAATFGLSAFVWHRMVLRFGGPRAWNTNLMLFAYTYLAKYLPTPLWFVGGRIAAYQRYGVSRLGALNLTALEVIFQVFTGGLLLAGLVFEPRRQVTWLVILLFLPLTYAMYRPNCVRGANAAKGLTLDAPIIRRVDLLEWLLVDLLVWILAGPFFVYVAKSVIPTIDIPFSVMWRVWIVANLAAYLSMVLLGGFGILREFSMAWLLSAHTSWPTAVVIAATARIVMTVAGTLFAGGTYLIARSVARRSVPPFSDPDVGVADR